jgi:hypothetical protein
MSDLHRGQRDVLLNAIARYLEELDRVEQTAMAHPGELRHRLGVLRALVLDGQQWHREEKIEHIAAEPRAVTTDRSTWSLCGKFVPYGQWKAGAAYQGLRILGLEPDEFCADCQREWLRLHNAPDDEGGPLETL